MKNFNFYIFFCAIMFLSQYLYSQDQILETRTVISGLDTPWEILRGGDGWIWFTERYGRISRVQPETGVMQTLITIPDVFEYSEGGLLGMALHPHFSDSPYVYVTYNYKPTSRVMIKLVRFTYDGNQLSNPHILIDSIDGNDNHNGSRVLFDNKGKILFTIGDAQTSSRAQDTSNLNGKILRINEDGTVPEDNPFPGNYIFTYGNRNPQGLVIYNGQIYESEHGANITDEVNFIIPGRDYGWPNVEGNCNTESEIQFCGQNNVKEPMIELNPTSTIAVSGLDYYNESMIVDFKKSLLATSLKYGGLIRLKLNRDEDSIVSRKDYFVGKYGRLRDLCIYPDGRVFIATSNKDGRGIPAADDDKIIEIKANTGSVDDNLAKLKLNIYPNPATNKITLSFNGYFSKEISYQIYNSDGLLLFSGNFNTTDNEIDLGGKAGFALTSGLYFIKLSQDNQICYSKFVVAN